MKKKTAEGILESLAWMSFPEEYLLKRIQEEPDEAQRERILEHLKVIMGAHVDLMFAVSEAYPELNPIGDGEELYYQYRLKYQTADFPAKRMSREDVESARKAGIEAAEKIKKELKDD